MNPVDVRVFIFFLFLFFLSLGGVKSFSWMGEEAEIFFLSPLLMSVEACKCIGRWNGQCLFGWPFIYAHGVLARLNKFHLAASGHIKDEWL